MRMVFRRTDHRLWIGGGVRRWLRRVSTLWSASPTSADVHLLADWRQQHRRLGRGVRRRLLEHRHGAFHPPESGHGLDVPVSWVWPAHGSGRVGFVGSHLLSWVLCFVNKVDAKGEYNLFVAIDTVSLMLRKFVTHIQLENDSLVLNFVTSQKLTISTISRICRPDHFQNLVKSTNLSPFLYTCYL